MEAKRNGMKRMLGAAVFMGLLFCLVSSEKAEAFDSHHHHHHHGGSKVGIGFGVGSSSYWVDGHYEERSETVMVEAAHYEKQFVAPTYKVVQLSDGTEMTVKVSDGYWTKIYVPARYETRIVQVYVPGYWASSGPTVRVGFGFRF